MNEKFIAAASKPQRRLILWCQAAIFLFFPLAPKGGRKINIISLAGDGHLSYRHRRAYRDRRHL
jgi:hypothetical protein